MKYISTDSDSDNCDIKHGQFTENPLRGSTTRYVANPIVDNIEADPDPDAEYVPPSCHVVGEPSVNNLATHRWQGSGLGDAATEAALIRRIQDGARTRTSKPRPHDDDQRAFRQLLEAFHRSVVGPAGKYIPKGAFERRQPKNTKHTDAILFEDLTSVGCLALWQSALRFKPGHRFNTISRHKIVGAISNEANYLRRRGYTSGDTVGRYLRKEVSRRTETRLDRWIFGHLGSPPEELLDAQKKLVKRPVFHSLEDAAEALKAANALAHPDVYSDGDEDGEDTGRNCESDSYQRPTEPLEESHDVYDNYNPLKWSPQLKTHQKVSAIVDFWTNEFCCPPRLKAKPKSKPVHPPRRVKPTGRILRPIDAPYWMTPRDKYPTYRVGKPYDPDRREVRAVKMKNGKTKQVYRQVAEPGRHIEVNEAKRKSNVRPNRNQASSGPGAEIIVFQGRGSGQSRLHIRVRHNPSGISERFACSGIVG